MKRNIFKLKGRFTLWPIALTIVVLTWVCLGLNHFAASRGIPELSCKSELYFQSSAAKTINHADKDHTSIKQLTFDLTKHDKQVLLTFSYLEDSKVLGSIEFEGRLLGLEVASMTYKLMLSRGDITASLDDSQLPQEIRQLIANEKIVNRHRELLPIDLQLLEANPDASEVIVQLRPSNNIWQCKMSA